MPFHRLMASGWMRRDGSSGVEDNGRSRKMKNLGGYGSHGPLFYLAGDSGRVSNDTGESWNTLIPPEDYEYCVDVTGSRASTYYGLFSSGVRICIARAATYAALIAGEWVVLYESDEMEEWQGYHISASNGPSYTATAAATAFKDGAYYLVITADSGANWSERFIVSTSGFQTGEEYTEGPLVSFAGTRVLITLPAIGEAGAELVAIGESDIYDFIDERDPEWQDITSRAGNPDEWGTAFHLLCLDGWLFYIAPDWDGLFRSADYGVTWEELAVPSALFDIEGVAVSTAGTPPMDPGRIAIQGWADANDDRLVLISDNYGESWSTVATIPDGGLASTARLAFDPNNIDHIVMAYHSPVDSTLHLLDITVFGSVNGYQVIDEEAYKFVNAVQCIITGTGAVVIAAHMETGTKSDKLVIWRTTSPAGGFTEILEQDYSFSAPANIATRGLIRVDGGIVLFLRDKALLSTDDGLTWTDKALPNAGAVVGYDYDLGGDYLYVLFHEAEDGSGDAGATYRIAAPSTSWSVVQLETLPVMVQDTQELDQLLVIPYGEAQEIEE